MMKYGGNPEITDKQGKSAVDLCRDSHIRDILINVDAEEPQSELSSDLVSPESQTHPFSDEKMSYKLSELTDYERFANSPHMLVPHVYETFGKSALKDMLKSPKSDYGRPETTAPDTDKSSKTREGELKPLYDWLEKVKLPELYDPLVEAGYDDLSAMVEQMHSPIPITVENLTKIGITKPGHRWRLLMRLEEEAGLTPRPKYKNMNSKQRGSLLNCCVTPTHATYALFGAMHLRDWLQGLRLSELYDYFVDAGYDDYESLLRQMRWRDPITSEILEHEIGITKPGYRNRILSKLHEDADRTFEANHILMIEASSKNVACNNCVIV